MTTSLTTEHYTHRWIRKDWTSILMRESDLENWREAKKQWYGSVLITRDLQWMIIYHAIADLIEEVIRIDIQKEQRIASEKIKNELYHSESIKNTENRKKWTENKLSEISKSEYEDLRSEAKEKWHTLESAINAYIWIAIRKKYKCPYK